MEKFWAKYKWGVIAAVVLVVGIIIYFVFFNKDKKSTGAGSGNGAGNDENGNAIPKPVYYTPEALAVLKDYKLNKNLDAYDINSGGTASEVLPGEYWWNAFCHRASQSFSSKPCEGDDKTEAYWEKLNKDTILSWFKGMNVNPVRAKTGTPDSEKLLDLLTEKAIVDSIKKYYETAWKNGEKTHVGAMEAGKYYNVFA